MTKLQKITTFKQIYGWEIKYINLLKHGFSGESIKYNGIKYDTDTKKPISIDFSNDYVCHTRDYKYYIKIDPDVPISPELCNLLYALGSESTKPTTFYVNSVFEIYNRNWPLPPDIYE